jgi:nitrate/nitrite transporter NarK
VERDFHPQVVGSPVRNMVAVLTNRQNYPLLISFSICAGVSLCLQMMIGQKFIEDFCGVTALEASNLTFVMMLVTMATLPVGGMISDRFQNRRLPFLIFVAVATLTGVLLILLGIHYKMPFWYFICAIIPPALGSGCAPVIQSMMKEQNPPQAVATSVGMLNATSYVMIAFTSQLTGMVMDLFNSQAVITAKARIYPPSAYVALFGILLALSLFALMVACFGREPSPSVIQANKRAGQLV